MKECDELNCSACPYGQLGELPAECANTILVYSRLVSQVKFVKIPASITGNSKIIHSHRKQLASLSGSVPFKLDYLLGRAAIAEATWAASAPTPERSPDFKVCKKGSPMK